MGKGCEMIQINENEAKVLTTNILRVVVEFCDKHKLKYYLAYGTLLGAVRHQGFIPWDNDVDIWMLREDYERFKSLYKEENNSRYTMLNVYDTKDYFVTTRVVDSKTIYYPVKKIKLKDMGIYIDIFPLDPVPNSTLENMMFWIKARMLGIIIGVSSQSGFYQSKNWYITLAKAVLYPIIKLFNCRDMAILLDKMGKRYDANKCTRIANLSGYGRRRETFNKTVFNKSTQLLFDGHLYNVPENYDFILSQIYGAYMNPPPIKERYSKAGKAYWRE